jgi:hypothetical protein
MWKVRIVSWVPGSPMDHGDNTDRLTLVNQVTTGQITP